MAWNLLRASRFAGFKENSLFNALVWIIELLDRIKLLFLYEMQERGGNKERIES